MSFEGSSRFRSDIAWSDAEHVVVHGLDLVQDLMGVTNLGDFGFLTLFRRLPNAGESQVFNAMLVGLAEHGLTANAIAARLTHLGAPESLQGAVAAGLLGLGTRFVGTIEGTARLLQEGPENNNWKTDELELRRLADELSENFLSRGQAVPGLGHPTHKPVDPRAERLFDLAHENGLDGAPERLLRAVKQLTETRLERVLPVNVTGAIGAISTSMGLRWEVSRGLGVMARAVGLVGHVLEEVSQPLADSIQRDVEERATRHLADGFRESH